MVNAHDKKPMFLVPLAAVALLMTQLFGVDSLSAQEVIPTAQPATDTAVSPQMARKAYMNCLLEVDKTGESLIGKGKAREAESKSQLQFCDNRKKDCGTNPNSPECHTFVEEFAAE